MPAAIDHRGKIFGRLVAISRLPAYKNKKTYYACLCSCGNYSIVSSNNLISGSIVSCGCYHLERITKHGIASSPIYDVWLKMINRCYNSKLNVYRNYGARGIDVCDDWKGSILSFYNWAINNGYDETLQIDRIDNNSGYSPKNCRFVSAKVNGRNKRTNVCIEYDNKNLCVSEWSEIKGISSSVLYSRINKGWKTKDILTKPIGKQGNGK